MITYSDLKNTYHTEKKVSSLSKINNNFYSEVQELLAQVEDSHKSHLTELLSEIYELRKNKIMLSAARAEKPENLIPADDEFYEEITNKLSNFRNKLLYVKTEIEEKGEKEETKEKEKKEGTIPAEKKLEIEPGTAETGKIKIRLIKNIPAIIGSDLVHYEFKEGDEVEIPKVDAKILIENGIAIRL